MIKNYITFPWTVWHEINNKHSYSSSKQIYSSTSFVCYSNYSQHGLRAKKRVIHAASSPKVKHIKITSHWKKKRNHFDIKSWVTGGPKIRPAIPSDWRILTLNIESTQKLTLNIESIQILTLNIESIQSQLKNWLSISSQFESNPINQCQFESSQSNHSESRVEF